MAKYETPGDNPVALVTISIKVPEGNDSLSALFAHLSDLEKPWFWEDNGGLSIGDTTQFWARALEGTVDENPYT